MQRALVLLVAASLALLFYKLGARPLSNWDEAIYAEASREMLLTGDWLTPRWNYRSFFHKPPLQFWLTAILFKLFSVSELWARAPSALSGVGLVALTYATGNYLYGKKAALLSALVLLSSVAFVGAARDGKLDAMLTFFIYLSLYGYLRAREDGRWWYLCGSGLGLALMTKGAAALAAPPALAVALYFDGRAATTLRSRHFWGGILVAAAVAAPWHLLMLLKHGQQFFDLYVGQQVVHRTAQVFEENNGLGLGPLFYPVILWQRFSPWFYLLPLTLIHAFRTRRESHVLLALVAAVFTLYTLSATKLPWYVAPAYPALTILTAKLICDLAGSKRIAWAAVCLLFAWGFYTLRIVYFPPETDEMKAIASVSRLARVAANDPGPLGTHPGIQMAPVALFYGHREVCAIGGFHPGALDDLARCGDRPAQIILHTVDAGAMRARTLQADGDFSYCLMGVD